MDATASALRQQLDAHFDRLTPEQQQHVLQLVTDLLKVPAPAQPNRWAHLAGLITPEDAEIMRQASLECRQLEPDTTPTW